MECRGADANQPQELARQQAKIVNAILGMDADIVGLMEIENEHPGQLDDEPVISLVDLLNAATEPGMYSYIATGPIGTDAIKQAILYKTEKVEVVGDFAVLDSSVDARFDTSRNRPSLAQTFMDKVTQEIFTVSVNHLKSKGSACADDPDLGDGAGNCNLTRKAAAEALVDWLESDPTNTGSDMYAIIGDLNSYAMEDPIDMIKLGADDLPDTADDYFNLVDRFREPAAYGYVYDGQTVYLDHALGNRKFASYVLDANFWHINADESDVFDYDTSFSRILWMQCLTQHAIRSSDHDPVLISVLLNHPPVATDDTFTTPVGSVLIVGAPGVLANDTDVNIYDKITVTLVVDSGPLHGELVLNEDGSFTYTPDPGFVGEDTFEYIMHATPGLMDNYSDTATVTITVTALQLFLPLILR
jgi:predicted extracellular nuclease